MHRPFLALVLTLLTLTPATRAADTLYFTSTPGSWIGQGQTLTFTSPSTSFSTYRYFNQGAYTNAVLLSAGGYELDLVGPNMSLPAVGSYPNATRWPFMGSGPGLWFTAPGRGDNQITGSFDIYQADYNPDGTVLAFAVDFIQYDETSTTTYTRGSFRYNSPVPIPAPEPSSLLAACGLSLPLLSRRRT